ncbi:hypothetical protein Osc7112_0321 [Oscillatoria nigro-viridis PCC 7112]|uniref:Uncharacterized protein n=1 Tax=Phormidium nigroviride PCC 7112 TaxID=179408 RepID=K9VCF7_9CYAN|nr:hypothetical protein Osc7112_0321 [Oscillatoria nigro-viridis PCC 7112]
MEALIHFRVLKCQTTNFGMSENLGLAIAQQLDCMLYKK